MTKKRCNWLLIYSQNYNAWTYRLFGLSALWLILGQKFF